MAPCYPVIKLPNLGSNAQSTVSGLCFRDYPKKSFRRVTSAHQETFFLVDLNLENRFILRFPSRTMMHLGYRTLPIDETGPALDISMMYDASINVLQIKLKQSIFETLRPSHTWTCSTYFSKRLSFWNCKKTKFPAAFGRLQRLQEAGNLPASSCRDCFLHDELLVVSSGFTMSSGYWSSFFKNVLNVTLKL